MTTRKCEEPCGDSCLNGHCPIREQVKALRKIEDFILEKRILVKRVNWNPDPMWGLFFSIELDLQDFVTLTEGLDYEVINFGSYHVYKTQLEGLTLLTEKNLPKNQPLVEDRPPPLLRQWWGKLIGWLV